MPIRPIVVLLLAFGLLTSARASPAELAIVRVDEGLAYVNIGSRDGVAAGQALEVVERAAPNESFHLGWIVLESVGEGLSMARVPDDLRAHVKQGTVVRLPRSLPLAPPPPRESEISNAPPVTV